MRFAICNETFQGWEWERTCRFVADTGYDGIEIAPFTLAEDVNEIDGQRRKWVKETAERAGLEIVGLHWLLISPKGLHLTAEDPDLRQRTVQYLCDLVDFAGDVGAPVMIFGSPKQRDLPAGVDPAQGRAWARDGVRTVGERGEKRGVTLCMEPLPPAETNFLTTLEDVASFIQEVNHPHVQMMMDVKSACSQNEPLEALYVRHADRIKHLHANDENRRGPGFGETKFVPLLKALLDHKYEGAVSVEVFDYSPDAETIARQSLEALRSALMEAEKR